MAFLSSVLCSLQYITLRISPFYQKPFQQKSFPKHTSMYSLKCTYMWYTRKKTSRSRGLLPHRGISHAYQQQLLLRMLWIQKQQEYSPDPNKAVHTFYFQYITIFPNVKYIFFIVNKDKSYEFLMEAMIVDKAYRKLFTELDILIKVGRKVRFHISLNAVCYEFFNRGTEFHFHWLKNDNIGAGWVV